MSSVKRENVRDVYDLSYALGLEIDALLPLIKQAQGSFKLVDAKQGRVGSASAVKAMGTLSGWIFMFQEVELSPGSSVFCLTARISPMSPWTRYSLEILVAIARGLGGHSLQLTRGDAADSNKRELVTVQWAPQLTTDVIMEDEIQSLSPELQKVVAESDSDFESKELQEAQDQQDQE